MLCGLFALFKFLPKELVNRVLSLYFVALGALACTATVAPFVARLLPRSLRGRAWEVKQLTIPVVLTVSAGCTPSDRQPGGCGGWLPALPCLPGGWHGAGQAGVTWPARRSPQTGA